MKISVRVIQFIVGILFIISGLVKANDPLGLSYKMQEFFEIWNDSLGSGSFFAKGIFINLFEFLHQHSLLLSVVMIALEIVTGIALLIGWKKKFIFYLLLLLIVFFTFLTGYALLSKNTDGSPKFTNCGCFGDCLPITPANSFTKDIVLLAMIIFLIFGQKYIQPLFRNRLRSGLVAAALVFSILIQLYVLHFLPFVDCLPFKKGNNIAEQMKPPPGSVPDSIAIRFIYEKAGKRFEFAPENLPADFETYTYIDRIDKLVRKGNAEPKIKGFSLTGAEITDSTSGTNSKPDSTQSILSKPHALIGFGLDELNNDKWLIDFKSLTEEATKKNIPVYFASNSREKYVSLFKQHSIQNVEVFDCDFTIIRTAARTNPIVYELKSGTIQKKYSWHHFDNLAEEIKNNQ